MPPSWRVANDTGKCVCVWPRATGLSSVGWGESHVFLPPAHVVKVKSRKHKSGDVEICTNVRHHFAEEPSTPRAQGARPAHTAACLCPRQARAAGFSGATGSHVSNILGQHRLQVLAPGILKVPEMSVFQQRATGQITLRYWGPQEGGAEGGEANPGCADRCASLPHGRGPGVHRPCASSPHQQTVNGCSEPPGASQPPSSLSCGLISQAAHCGLPPALSAPPLGPGCLDAEETRADPSWTLPTVRREGPTAEPDREGPTAAGSSYFPSI